MIFMVDTVRHFHRAFEDLSKVTQLSWQNEFLSYTRPIYLYELDVE